MKLVKGSARYKEVGTLVSAYNVNERDKPGYVSPFIARDLRGLKVFEAVAEKIGVPPEELFEFLKLVETDLPPIEA